MNFLKILVTIKKFTLKFYAEEEEEEASSLK